MTRMYRLDASGIYLKGLFYGDAGSGKTTLLASAQDHPAMRNLVVLNVEGGLLSVAHRGDIRVIDIGNTAEVEGEFWRIIKDKESGKGRYANVNTVGLDNGTELQAINLQEIVANSIATTNRPDTTRDEIWQDDYGKSTVQLKRIYRWFRQAPIHFFVTAHAKRVYPRTEGRAQENLDPIAVLPSMTAKLSEAVMGYMDFVWYLKFDPDEEGGKPAYWLLTRTDGVYFAKTRNPRFRRALGQVWKIPQHRALAKIYDIYLNAVTTPKPETENA